MGGDLDATDFQRAAELDGFTVAKTEMTAGKVTLEHDHAWDIRGMVLEGRFTVDVSGSARATGRERYSKSRPG